MPSKSITVNLSISADEYLIHYQGAAREVIALTTEGQKVRFPSNILQPFVDHDGVHGTFVIVFDEHHKFQKIRRLG